MWTVSYTHLDVYKRQLVEKSVVGDRQYWRRTITYPDGRVLTFDSFWVVAGGNQVIEFVNPLLGLQMAARVVGGQLHYCGCLLYTSRCV